MFPMTIAIQRNNRCSWGREGEGSGAGDYLGEGGGGRRDK